MAMREMFEFPQGWRDRKRIHGRSFVRFVIDFSGAEEPVGAYF